MDEEVYKTHGKYFIVDLKELKKDYLNRIDFRLSFYFITISIISILLIHSVAYLLFPHENTCFSITAFLNCTIGHSFFLFELFFIIPIAWGLFILISPLLIKIFIPIILMTLLYFLVFLRAFIGSVIMLPIALIAEVIEKQQIHKQKSD